MSFTAVVTARLQRIAASDDFGVDATYYPAVIEGYDTATQTRTPSETSGLSIRGILRQKRQQASDSVYATSTLFTLPTQSALTVTPKANDRIEIERDSETLSYRVVDARALGTSAASAGWTLTLASEGTV